MHLKGLLLETRALHPVPRVGAPLVGVGHGGVEGSAPQDDQEGEEAGEGLID